MARPRGSHYRDWLALRIMARLIVEARLARSRLHIELKDDRRRPRGRADSDSQAAAQAVEILGPTLRGNNASGAVESRLRRKYSQQRAALERAAETALRWEKSPPGRRLMLDGIRAHQAFEREATAAIQRFAAMRRAEPEIAEFAALLLDRGLDDAKCTQLALLVDHIRRRWNKAEE